MDASARPMEPQHNYWAALAGPVRDALTQVARHVVIQAGNPLRMPGLGSGDVLIVRTGLVKVVARAGRRSVVLALRGPGDIIGEIGYITGDPGLATLSAITTVEALYIAHADYLTALRRYPIAERSMYRTVGVRLREADRDRIAAASMNVGQRLARLLLKVIQWYQPAPDGAVTIDGLSQSELAACIGGAPRTVAREIAAWKQRGIVSTHWRAIVVHDPDELRRIAGPGAPRP